MSFRLSAHVALVTGSTTGLGKTIAMTLGRAGAKVCLNYSRDANRAEHALAEMRDAGIKSTLVRADITDQDAITRLFREGATGLGNVDILVVNAAGEHRPQSIVEYDWASCQSMIDYFLKSPFLMTREALPHMRAQRWGRIINIVSDVFHRGSAPFSGYAAAKGAQIGWSRSVARELAPFGITVNMVAPGWIPVARHATEPHRGKDEYLATIPAKRWGVPRDVGDAVLYLASEEASFVTGQTLLCERWAVSVVGLRMRPSSAFPEKDRRQANCRVRGGR